MNFPPPKTEISTAIYWEKNQLILPHWVKRLITSSSVFLCSKTSTRFAISKWTWNQNYFQFQYCMSIQLSKSNRFTTVPFNKFYYLRSRKFLTWTFQRNTQLPASLDSQVYFKNTDYKNIYSYVCYKIRFTSQLLQVWNSFVK